MGRKVVVILGHPQAESLCGALARAHAEGAREAGATVELVELGKLAFDPVLRRGFADGQPLEPDLERAWAAMAAADELVFVHPTWWGGPPALLKGFIDRVFLPGHAFRYREGSPFPDQLLRGKTARLLVTMDSPPWWFRWVTGQPGHRLLKKAVLEFCGVKPVTVHAFGPVRGSTPARREAWLDRARRLGAAR